MPATDTPYEVYFLAKDRASNILTPDGLASIQALAAQVKEHLLLYVVFRSIP